jgi:Fe-S-cluster-containing dehydrogenase component
MEQGLPIGQFGIKIAEIGPWKIGEDRWQYSYVPIPTEQCNLCGKRVAQGKLPACVHHCQAAVMRYGKVDELAKEIGDKRQMALFTP